MLEDWCFKIPDYDIFWHKNMEENEDVKLLSFLSHNNAFNELFAGDGRFGKRGRFDDQFVLEFLFIQLTEYLLFLFLFFF